MKYRVSLMKQQTFHRRCGTHMAYSLLAASAVRCTHSPTGGREGEVAASHRKGFGADGCLGLQAWWQSFLPTNPSFSCFWSALVSVCVGITLLLHGGQLTDVHPLISPDTMLELVLGVGESRLEADCDSGFEDVECWTIPDVV